VCTPQFTLCQLQLLAASTPQPARLQAWLLPSAAREPAVTSFNSHCAPPHEALHNRPLTTPDISCSVALKTAVGSSASDEHTTLTAGCVLSIRSSARSSARSSTLQVCTSSTRDMHMSNTIAEANATVTSFRGGSMLSRAVSSKQKTLALHSFTLSMSLPKHRHGSSRPTRRRRQRHGPRRHPRATARWR
jgi:hypothetical protein